MRKRFQVLVLLRAGGLCPAHCACQSFGPILTAEVPHLPRIVVSLSSLAALLQKGKAPP